MVGEVWSRYCSRYFSCRRYAKEFLIKFSELLTVIMEVQVKFTSFQVARLGKGTQTTLGYRLLHSPFTLANSSTIEIPDITGMLE
jgi:hypothetical protein